MNIGNWLATARARLQKSGSDTARLDCLVLLEDCLQRERSWLLAHPEHELTAEQRDVLDTQLARRSQHEPLAYIRGHSEFYGREFIVNPHVLVPRPESEAMIELLRWLVTEHNPDILRHSSAELRIVDVGSGSGCLGITAALELGLKQAWFHDISSDTFTVASQNAHQYGVAGTFLQTDLLSTGDYDIVLANLPYVPDTYPVNEAARHEPAVALFGGDDGLDLYRRMFTQAANQPSPPGYILTEALPQQHAELTRIAADSGYSAMRGVDFVLVFEYQVSTGPRAN